MPEFKEKAKRVDAIEFRKETFKKVVEFTGNAVSDLVDNTKLNRPSTATLQSLQGVTTLVEGDFVVKSETGGFQVYKPEVFNNQYEEV